MSNAIISSKQTTQPGMGDTPAGLPPPRNGVTFWSQQPPGGINTGIQMQGSQAPFFAPPTVYANFHQGQANIQLVKPPVETGASNFKQEAKVLGGIEILIGVMHLGFGIVLGLMYGSYATVWGFTSISFIGGYTIWGGISFIISGSLSISASKVFSPCLIKGSLGMNIVSAIFAIVGMILLVVDVSINGVYYQDYWAVIAGKGISAMLMIFTLLEFSIACTLAHFATQAIPSTNMPAIIIPNVYPMTSAPSSVPTRIDSQPAYGSR